MTQLKLTEGDVSMEIDSEGYVKFENGDWQSGPLTIAQVAQAVVSDEKHVIFGLQHITNGTSNSR